jgi:iron complex outermembrane receptor protein
LIQRWRLPRPVRRTQCRHPGEWTDHSHLGFSPVNLDAQNTYYGLYANETFNVTDRLSLTAGGRYNLAKIVMADVLGTSPDINGNFTFTSSWPLAGRVHQ